MHRKAGVQRRRIVRVREAQRLIARGKLAMATRAVAEIDERRDLVARLVGGTLPQALSYDGIDFIGRMRFAGRMTVAQRSLEQARIEATAAIDRRVAALRRADANAEIAQRMLAAETEQGLSAAQRRALETMSGSPGASRRDPDQ